MYLNYPVSSIGMTKILVPVHKIHKIEDRYLNEYLHIILDTYIR